MLIHSILKLPVGTSKEDMKKAYRKKVMELHPDRGGNLQAFQSLQKAYEDYLNFKEPKKVTVSSDPMKFNGFGSSLFDLR